MGLLFDTLTSPLSVDISKDGPMNLWSATTAPATEEILTAPWMCPEQKISPELVVIFKAAVLILWTWTEPVSAVTWQKSHSIKSDTSTLASSRDATLTLWTTGAWKKVACKYIRILDMVVGKKAFSHWFAFHSYVEPANERRDFQDCYTFNRDSNRTFTWYLKKTLNSKQEHL